MADRKGTKKAASGPAASGSEDDRNASQADFDGNSGPGTGVDAPPDAGPIYPTQQNYAEDADTQTQPADGYDESSTDDTYAAVGGRTIAGESHLGLEDEDGNDVSEPEFEDEGGSMLKVKKTVIQRFSYPNSGDHEEKRLLLSAGQRVSRRQADMLKASLERQQEPTFGEKESA